MTASLDNAFAATCLQTLNSLSGLVDRAEAHCAERGLPAETLTDARLAPDMWPFAKQIFEAGHHSARAVAAVRAGIFSPELAPAPTDFASLRNELAETIATLEALPAGELDSIAGRDTRFEFGTMRMDFTVADFLLSFSLPNFFFHTTTAYAILRNQGLGIGKRDFLGQVRVKA
ncbi:DUF1993 domain-containing protein [Novosphingobium mangrovi (ex Huang et al. 2023)]|uniref:DUF1993 domain-containing protein n=1 Tax=Novosphingobium mangrovi (ex Huang et al. 2023) TaxID=2976432 RepID=A0ABT2I1Z1_9SPHN|nr:DUF1993 domain-containing protein [Novosphingobium mangrovi (ex Huang et al. 2023)]MCT2398825.1 DUF1993 domain-containing protein [Novosphingobium mangrovi (ex Huang et al. 2023)]